MKEINFSKQQFKSKVLENIENIILIGSPLGIERPLCVFNLHPVWGKQ